MVHAKLLQKGKEIMSINYTATISMNYTTPPPLVKSHFTPQMAGESKKLKHNFSNSIYTQYKHYIKLAISTYRKFSWSMGTCIRIILTTVNVLLCADGIHITYPNCSGYMQLWISLGCCSTWVLSLPNGIGRGGIRGKRNIALPQESRNEVGNKTHGGRIPLCASAVLTTRMSRVRWAACKASSALQKWFRGLSLFCKGTYTTIACAVVYKVA